MSAYTGDIVKDGLVLCLDAGNRKSFVSGSTTWVDLSANRKNGTLTNGPTFISSNGGTIAFDGSNDYVNVSGFNVNHGTGNFSYSCWAYLTGKPSLGTIFENGSWTNCILIRYESNGITIYSMNAFHGKFTFNPDLNTWNHLTFVRSGNSILFYLNGEFSASTGFGTNLNVNPSPANLFIGVSQHALTQCFNGRLNNLLVYNRALSAAEIRENYNATKGRYDTTRSSDAIKPRLSTSGLVLHLDAANYRSFVSGSTTWRDLSGNGFNGTLTNGPVYSSANNGSIIFDGTNDFVQCTGTIVTTAATFLVWIYRNGEQGQYDAILFSRGTSVTGLGIFSSNQLGYHWNNNANTYNWASGLTIPNLQWSLCAVSVGPTSATAYLCQQTGITSAVNNVSHASTTIDDIKIGTDEASAARSFAGNIAVAQIYNRALSRDEIVQYFNTTKVRYGYVL